MALSDIYTQRARVKSYFHLFGPTQLVKRVEEYEKNPEVANIITNIVYMVVMRGEYSKQLAYEAYQYAFKNKKLFRWNVKRLGNRVMKDIVRYDRMTAEITSNTIEYYDGVTDYFVENIADETKAACTAIFNALMKAGMPAEDSDMLSRMEMANIMLDYSVKRMEKEVDYYKRLNFPIERLRYLANKELAFDYDRFVVEVGNTAFPKHAAIDLNKEQAVVDSLHVIFDKMSNPEYFGKIINEYNKRYDKENGSQNQEAV